MGYIGEYSQTGEERKPSARYSVEEVPCLDSALQRIPLSVVAGQGTSRVLISREWKERKSVEGPASRASAGRPGPTGI